MIEAIAISEAYVRFLAETKLVYMSQLITKTRLFKYIENFTTKNENFQIQNSDSFHISTQNIDCGYSLEPPR